MGQNKILVVDDDKDILEVVGIVLESAGYDVDLLPKGEKIFDHINHFQPDLIILDVMLGNVDGRILCNQIKRTESISHIPVIIISASHGLKEMLKESCSPNEYISKPFDIDHLISTVQRQLST